MQTAIQRSLIWRTHFPCTRLLQLICLFWACLCAQPIWAQNTTYDMGHDAALLQETFAKMQAGDFPGAVQPARSAWIYRNQTLGPGHIETINAAGNLAFILVQAGNATRAATILETIIPQREALAGRDEETMLLIKTLGMAYDSAGQCAKAIEPYASWLDHVRAGVPAEHPLLANAAGSLAWCLDAEGRYDEARPLYEETLRIREASSTDAGADPLVGMALNNLANLYYTQGDYAEAIAGQKRALEILARAHGPEHPEVANAMNNLGMFLSDDAQYAKAEALLKQSIAIHTKQSGQQAAQLAEPINNLAQLKLAMLDFDAALALQKQSVAIREAAFGPTHPQTAMGQHNLASVYEAMGRYDAAKTIYEDALLRFEQALGPKHPLVAFTLSNMAILLGTLGDTSRALELHARALAIRQEALGETHPDVANSLHNIGNLHLQQKDYPAAQEALGKSREILLAAFPPKHPSIAENLNSLCLAQTFQGKHEAALVQCGEALAIRLDTLGEDHLHTWMSRHSIAAIKADMGRYQEARTDFDGVLEGFTRVLGPDHPHVSNVYRNISRIEASLGNNATALDFLLQAERINTQSLDTVMAVTVEREKLAYIASLENGLHILLTMVNQRLRDDGEAVRKALDLWLARKGLALEAQRRFQEALYTSPDPEVQSRLQELAGVRGRLSELTYAGPGKMPPAAYQAQLQHLNKRKNDLEMAITNDFAPLARKRQRESADTANLQALLPAGAALVEIARTPVYRFGEPHHVTKWDPARYLAFVLPQAGTPVLVDCGDAETIDSLITQLKHGIMDVSDVSATKATAAGRALYDALFAPLLPALGNATSLFISPDGNINLIPFEVLVDAQGRHLIEQFTFNYLAAGRDLAVQGAAESAPAPEAGQPVLVGDPTFDATSRVDGSDRPDGNDEHGEADGSGTAAQEVPPAPLLQRETGLPLSRAARENFRSLTFTPLPGTADEVATLSALLPNATVLLGSNATERNILAMRRPSLLHMATHGFFLDDDQLPAAAALTRQPAQTNATVADYVTPLLRAGLALAGANQGRETGHGLLTAEKILAMDLSATSLVTLSACETGLGESLAGEGVFGLRRAFLQAGAKRIVMSLWSVPDTETAQLMERFYQQHLASGLPASQALREAALAQRTLQRRRLGHTHPFYWGAFILVGEP